MATFARLVFRFAPDDDKPLDLFDEDEPPLDLLPAERPLLDVFLDDSEPDDDELFDLPPDEEVFDLLPDKELLLLLLFEPTELFDELVRLPAGDLDEPFDFRPFEDEEDDLDLPAEPVERPAEPDFDRPPPDAAIFSAAAPAAAPLMISPATSMTLSTIPDELRDLDDFPRDEVDEDELLFREPPDLDLLAITSLRMIVIKNLTVCYFKLAYRRAQSHTFLLRRV